MPTYTPPSSFAPDPGSDVILDIAFDNRRSLWRPPSNHIFSVEIRAPHIDESVYASFDRLQIASIMAVCNALLDGDAEFVFADEAQVPPNVFLDIYETIPDYDPAFRGGLCYPDVLPDGTLIGGRLVWTAWKHGFRLHNGSGLHEFAHLFGFGHTPSRDGCIVMGSCPNAVDFAPIEYETWGYMRTLRPGALNPRFNELRSTMASSLAGNSASKGFACPL